MSFVDVSAGRAIARGEGEGQGEERAREKRLTDYSSCGGCASKLAAGEFSRVLGAIARAARSARARRLSDA